MYNVVIVGALRTPIGRFGGSLRDIPAPKLASEVIKALIKKTNIDPKLIDEVIMGQVLQAGCGQNPARQAAIMANLPQHIPAETINAVCGSGLAAVINAAKKIMLGDSQIIIAGGMENMSASPYLSYSRWGSKMGDQSLIDAMLNDALTDAYSKDHMMKTAENICDRYRISREELDEFAFYSQEKAKKAINEKKFYNEIVPINIDHNKIFSIDEYPRETSIEKLNSLATVNGYKLITPGNSSGINDGAACLILMREEKAMELGIKPIAKFVDSQVCGCDPQFMGLGPIYSTQKIFKRTGLTIEDIDLIEANEAFAAQSIAVARELKFDPNKLNVNGGAIALGHPVGASGARILVTLIHEMEKRNSLRGLATICVGGGMGYSLITELVK